MSAVLELQAFLRNSHIWTQKQEREDKLEGQESPHKAFRAMQRIKDFSYKNSEETLRTWKWEDLLFQSWA